MQSSERMTRMWLGGAIVGAVALAAGVVGEAGRRQIRAPHEQSGEGAPPAIDWDTPPLPRRSVDVETAEERRLRLTVVARHLEQPWSMAFLPDGAMLVTERPGRLRLVRDGALDPTPIGGVPAVSTTGSRGLQGLMDIALHPRFHDNGWIYLTYHKPVAAPPDGSQASDDSGVTTLARGVWADGALRDVHDIFNSGARDTEASRIAFGGDGLLYMTISGPGGGPGAERAQAADDYAGKVIRLRDDGRIPSDNPFVRRRNHKPAIFTLGHRNGSGLALNPLTGQMWEAEQGPNGGDEVNILAAGKNYGWPLVSFGRDYQGSPISVRPTRAGFEDPEVVWLPSIAVTGMVFYTGDRFPRWKHNLFVTGLRQGGIPRTGQVQRIEFNDQWEELRREPLLTTLQQRIRDIRQGPDGLLYILTAEDDGALLRLEPR